MPAEFLNWDFQTLDQFSADPQEQGNRMPFAGAADSAKRASRRQKVG
jgi:cytochrome c2